MSEIIPIDDYRSEFSPVATSFASCVTFQAYFNDIHFPDVFTMPNGFTFTRLGSSQFFISSLRSGLRFDDLGIQIDLPEPKSDVQLVLFGAAGQRPAGEFAVDLFIDVAATDDSGSVIDSARVPNDQFIYLVQLTGEGIVSVTVAGGVEGHLVQVCAS
ncbi:MAG: hypothetical protein KDE23_08055 [Caldilinea sp.]|nr:hypothetical protein [Caldilinea sp.]